MENTGLYTLITSIILWLQIPFLKQTMKQERNLYKIF